MYIQRIYCSCINDERTLVGVDIFNSMFDILDIVIVGRGFPEDTLCLSISAAIDHISTIRMHAHANTSTTLHDDRRQAGRSEEMSNRD